MASTFQANGSGSQQSTNSHDQIWTVPAESAPHSHTLMAFPSIASADSESDLTALQSEVTSIANTIAQFEPVHLYSRPELSTAAQALISPNVTLKTGPVDQLWIRDSGPIYVRDRQGQRAALVANFNYWGAKLPRTGDEGLAAQIARSSNERTVSTRLVIEGGAIEHDGDGTFLGTESCIVNPNRNPDLTKDEIEHELRRVLGVEGFIWLPGHRDIDITDDHIDALARFVAPGIVVVSKPAPNTPGWQLQEYEAVLQTLRSSKDVRGRSLTVHECQEPDLAIFGPPDAHNEVVASYVNYLLVNGGVILAKFGVEDCDAAALELFKKLFAERQVVQVKLNMLPRTGGGIHCATQHVPA